MNENIKISVALVLSVFLFLYSFFIYTPMPASSNLASVSGQLVLEWGDMGKRMAQDGVMDAKKMEEIHSSRGEMGEMEKKMLYGNSDLIINSSSSGFALNLLWAFGLGNKNKILDEGPMMTHKNGAANFASTGGWTLSQGDVMDHYSMHSWVTLSDAEQELVERVSKNIYRPCCGNSTFFPDCNHGMAMLGLLELMASQGKTEKEMYDAALFVNRLWFPDEYANIYKYFDLEGLEKEPKVMLSADYSSGQGYRKVMSKINPNPQGGGASCGV